MQHKIVWIGTSTLWLDASNPKRADGFVGAFASFACVAENLADAVKALHLEFLESGFVLIGIERMVPVSMLDRELTEFEVELVDATEIYPIQFKNVHLHKGDG